MPELHIGILLGDAGDHLSPQPGTIEDVGFVDGSNLSAAGLSQHKSHASNALDFRFAIAHGVDRNAAAGSALGRAGFAEIYSSQEFTHDQDVGASDHLGTKRRAIFQRGETYGWPPIGEGSEFSAQSKQSAFGAQIAGHMVERGASDSAQQDGARSKASLQCILR